MNHAFYVGIDISKAWFDAAILNSETPRKTHHYQFKNTIEGFNKFLKWLKQQGVKSYSEAFVCLEHTGVYVVPLCRFLSSTEISYSLVPGSEISLSLGIIRGKNDKIDAKRIAQYAYKNRDFTRIHTLPVEAIRKLKALLSHRERLVKAKHSFTVSTKELKAFETSGVVEHIADSSAQVLDELNEQIKQTEQALDLCVQSHAELKRTYELLLSVPGIGAQNALYLIAATQNFVSFNCPKKFASYAGVAPFKSESGASQRSKSKVSHQANKKIKTLLTNSSCDL